MITSRRPAVALAVAVLLCTLLAMACLASVVALEFSPAARAAASAVSRQPAGLTLPTLIVQVTDNPHCPPLGRFCMLGTPANSPDYLMVWTGIITYYSGGAGRSGVFNLPLAWKLP